MNILSIGNSFSQDAHRYLHSIAKADNCHIDTYNLYIGGCQLSHHYRNMLGDKKEYALEMNGRNTGFAVSMKEALLNRNWDVVTIQQVSNEAPFYDTYQPYISKIAEYIRTCVPKTKIGIHQTWAYEKDSRRLNEELGFKSHEEMFDRVKKSYDEAAKAVNADFIIPSGAVFRSLNASGVKNLFRDTFHASLGLGRYALGLTWYVSLTGHGVDGNSFAAFDEAVSPSQMLTVKACVEETCKKYLG